MAWSWLLSSWDAITKQHRGGFVGGQSRAILGLSAAAIVGLGMSKPAAAQVSADIHIGSFPVAATVHIGGDRYKHPRRFRHEVIYVRKGRGHGHHRNHR